MNETRIPNQVYYFYSINSFLSILNLCYSFEGLIYGNFFWIYILRVGLNYHDQQTADACAFVTFKCTKI